MAWSLVADETGTASGGTDVVVSKSVLTGAQADDILIVSGVCHTPGNWTAPNAWDFSAMAIDPDVALFNLSGTGFAFGNDPTGRKDIMDYLAGSYALAGGESSSGDWTFVVDPAGSDSHQAVRVMLFRAEGAVSWEGVFSEGVLGTNADVDPNFGVGMDAQADTSLTFVDAAQPLNMLLIEDLYATVRFDETTDTVTTVFDPSHDNVFDLPVSPGRILVTQFGQVIGSTGETVTGTVTTTGTKCAGSLFMLSGWAETPAAAPADTEGGGSVYTRRHTTARALPYELTTGDLRGIPWQDVYPDSRSDARR